MPIAVKKRVTVQQGGRIEVFVPDLAEGTSAEVTIRATDRPSSGGSLAGRIGSGKGAFASAGEVDLFIRAERDRWP